jgi:hypothetical protein
VTAKESEEAVDTATGFDDSRARQPDPWGVRRAEVLISSLKGVLSSRVVVSPDGEITEIHVLTETGLTPKQVVRNVESALLAQLGIKVDHRRISVAQTAEVLPMEAMEQRVVQEQARRRGILFQKVEVVSSKPQKVMVQVTLEQGGEEVMAEEESADVPTMRAQAAARATVTALDGLIEEGTVDLAGVKFLEAFDTRYVFVGVNILTGRDSFLHAGSCEIKRGAEQAAAMAVLDATNRWLVPHM